MPQKELWEAYSNRTVCSRVQCISRILFVVGIPNLDVDASLGDGVSQPVLGSL